MNKFRAYIFIDGRNFNPNEFQASIRSKDAGTVHSTYRMETGVKQESGKYWKSSVKEPDTQHVEEDLYLLLKGYSRHLVRARKLGATRIFATILADMDESDTTRGYFFSKKIIQLLFKYGVELDVGIARK